MTLLISNIAQCLGQTDVFLLEHAAPNLRKKNTIKTIKATLAIEGNTFSEEHITAILENKKVFGEKKEVMEVKNAIELYNSMSTLRPDVEKEFLKAHSILMKGLVASAGKYRSKNVGIIKGTKVKHLAPKPKFLSDLMNNLFLWYKEEKDLHPLIKSSIIHYEIEFIHPFEDGNGRMGRFWQTLILGQYHPFFKLIPTESLIEKNQELYYDTLELCDKKGNSTAFIEFMLEIILLATQEALRQFKPKPLSSQDRIFKARKKFKQSFFSRKEYLNLFKYISTATASRDLKKATDEGVLLKKGDNNQTCYSFRNNKSKKIS